MKKLKKILFVVIPFLLIALNTAGQNNNNFKVTIRYDSSINAKAYLFYYNEKLRKRISDSATILNGVCSFEGFLNSSSVGFIKLIPGTDLDQTFCNFFIDKGNYSIFITTKKQNYQIYKAINSSTNIRYISLLRSSEQIEKEKNRIILSVKARDSLEYNIRTKAIIEDFRIKSQNNYINYFLNNPNSFITLYMLQSYLRKISLENLQFIFDRLSDENKNSLYGMSIKEQLFQKNNVVIGNKAINFTSISENGKVVKLYDLKNKNIVIDFWATWCKPCLEQFKMIANALKNYNDTSLVIITIADDEQRKELWKQLLNKFNLSDHINLLNTIQLNSNNRPISKIYNVSLLPTTFFLNKQFIIKKITVGLLNENDFIKNIEDTKK